MELSIEPNELIVIKRYILAINTAMGVLCPLVESRKSVHCLHFDFIRPFIHSFIHFISYFHGGWPLSSN